MWHIYCIHQSSLPYSSVDVKSRDIGCIIVDRCIDFLDTYGLFLITIFIIVFSLQLVIALFIRLRFVIFNQIYPENESGDFAWFSFLRDLRGCCPEELSLYIPTSVCIFSKLFSMHFLGCWQGEFVQQSRASLVDDHSLNSHDLNVWFRDGIVGRNLMLVTPRVQRVTWKVVVFVTGKDVKDLHQISPHHCLNKELLLRLQQGTCVS